MLDGAPFSPPARLPPGTRRVVLWGGRRPSRAREGGRALGGARRGATGRHESAAAGAEAAQPARGPGRGDGAPPLPRPHQRGGPAGKPPRGGRRGTACVGRGAVPGPQGGPGAAPSGSRLLAQPVTSSEPEPSSSAETLCIILYMCSKITLSASSIFPSGHRAVLEKIVQLCLTLACSSIFISVDLCKFFLGFSAASSNRLLLSCSRLKPCPHLIGPTPQLSIFPSGHRTVLEKIAQLCPTLACSPFFISVGLCKLSFRVLCSLLSHAPT